MTNVQNVVEDPSPLEKDNCSTLECQFYQKIQTSHTFTNRERERERERQRKDLNDKPG